MQSSRQAQPIRNILVVEDNPQVLRILERMFRLHTSFQPVYCASMSEAQGLLKNAGKYMFAAVVDLNLPDANDGQIVDLVLEHQLPCIALTANYDEQRRDQLLLKGVVDYVLKDSDYAYEYAFQLLSRLESNQHIKILIAEDSEATRQYIRHVLSPHRYQLIDAENGDQALAILRQQPDIDLLLVDHGMPGVSGFDLVKKMRQDDKRKELIILGLSTDAQGSLSAKFIKNGADDFLRKPFCPEELNCRVMSSIERRNLLRALKQAAQFDALTGLNNRRAFYEQGQKLLNQAQTTGESISTVMLDLDFFKRINDEFGHASGDAALVSFSRAFSEAFPDALLGRLGGEEFAMLSMDDVSTLDATLNQLREHCLITDYSSGAPPLSFSAGIHRGPATTLEALLHQADTCLYQAKNLGRGRNFFITHDELELSC